MKKEQNKGEPRDMIESTVLSDVDAVVSLRTSDLAKSLFENYEWAKKTHNPESIFLIGFKTALRLVAKDFNIVDNGWQKAN